MNPAADVADTGSYCLQLGRQAITTYSILGGAGVSRCRYISTSALFLYFVLCAQAGLSLEFLGSFVERTEISNEDINHNVSFKTLV